MGDNYLISQNDPSLLSGATTAVIILAVLFGLIALAIFVLMIVANCKVFKKAGEKWWKALMPLYNSWIETKITGLAWWWFPIYLVILVVFAKDVNNTNYVITWALILTSFNYNYNLAKKFGKGNGFAVLNTILPWIGLPILAFGSAKYDKEAKVEKNGIFTM